MVKHTQTIRRQTEGSSPNFASNIKRIQENQLTSIPLKSSENLRKPNYLIFAIHPLKSV